MRRGRRIYVKCRKLVVWHRILSIGQSRRSASIIATCPIHGYPVDFALLLCVLPSVLLESCTRHFELRHQSVMPFLSGAPGPLPRKILDPPLL